MNQGLHDQLLGALMALVFVKMKEEKKKNLFLKLEQLRENVANAKAIDPKKEGRKVGCVILLIGIFAFIYLLGIVRMPLVALFDEIGIKVFVTVLIIMMAIALVVRWRTTSKAQKKKEKEIQAQEAILLQEEPLINADIANIEQEINQSAPSREATLAFLPSKYRNLHATNFMFEAVENLRADTLKEAINLYEAYLSDMELKNQLNQMQMATQMQTEQLEIMNNYMEQINRNQAQMSDDIADIKYTQYLEWLRNS